MKKVKEPKLIREEAVGKAFLRLFRGDIARVGGGAIMNPTNPSLSRNSGLASYLVDSAGSKILLEINAWKQEHEGENLNPGDIAITGGGNLPAIHLFHTCIPPYNRDDPEPLVRMFVLKVLEQTEELQAQCVILPCLPKDTFGFSPEQCAFGYVSSVIDYLNSHAQSGLKEVKMVTLDKKATKLFEKEMDRRFGVKEKKSFFSFGKKKKVKKDGSNTLEMT